MELALFQGFDNRDREDRDLCPSQARLRPFYNNYEMLITYFSNKIRAFISCECEQLSFDSLIVKHM